MELEKCTSLRSKRSHFNSLTVWQTQQKQTIEVCDLKNSLGFCFLVLGYENSIDNFGCNFKEKCVL